MIPVMSEKTQNAVPTYSIEFTNPSFFKIRSGSIKPPRTAASLATVMLSPYANASSLSLNQRAIIADYDND